MNISEIINNFINQIGAFGPLFACLFIVIESIIPVLPLAVFITINFLIYGTFIGFVISWIFTIIGCILSYLIFYKGFADKFDYLTKDTNIIKKLVKKIKKLTTGQLVILMAIPFFPAFSINIAAGLSKIKFKKFFVSLLIGKISIVYFWGFVGTSLIESITNPIIIIKIVVSVLIAYVISKIVNKKLNLD